AAVLQCVSARLAESQIVARDPRTCCCRPCIVHVHSNRCKCSVLLDLVCKVGLCRRRRVEPRVRIVVLVEGTGIHEQWADWKLERNGSVRLETSPICADRKLLPHAQPLELACQRKIG